MSALPLNADITPSEPMRNAPQFKTRTRVMTRDANRPKKPDELLLWLRGHPSVPIQPRFSLFPAITILLSSPVLRTTKKPLITFQRNFCAEQPVITPEAGSLHRTAMTQPGVYFTLDAPFVRVIGLFSNALE